MKELIDDFLKQKRFAVVGSFKSKDKFAYRILLDLVEKGYEVFPVHPTIHEVEGRPCYKTISDIPQSVDVVNLVTPFLVTEKLVRECLNRGIRRVWLQPGSESHEAIKFSDDNNIKVVHGVCVMLKLLKVKLI